VFHTAKAESQLETNIRYSLFSVLLSASRAYALTSKYLKLNITRLLVNYNFMS